MDKTTPTPWRTDGDDLSVIVADIEGSELLWMVCETFGPDTERNANAAHIVQCVNEREGLLTELRELRGALEAARSDSHAWEATANDWKDRHAAVTAALSDADNLIEEWIGILLENGMRDTAIDGEAMRATIAALRARGV